MKLLSFFKRIFCRQQCEHEWNLQRTLGGDERRGRIVFKHGSRLFKFCDKCGKQGHPTKQELEDNPPIFKNL